MDMHLVQQFIRPCCRHKLHPTRHAPTSFPGSCACCRAALHLTYSGMAPASSEDSRFALWEALLP